jgi:hypothetical protein
MRFINKVEARGFFCEKKRLPSELGCVCKMDYLGPTEVPNMRFINKVEARGFFCEKKRLPSELGCVCKMDYLGPTLRDPNFGVLTTRETNSH